MELLVIAVIIALVIYGLERNRVRQPQLTPTWPAAPTSRTATRNASHPNYCPANPASPPFRTRESTVRDP